MRREEWGEIEGSLEKQRVNSVVYIALGIEAMLSQDKLTGLALGLERSRLPFFWVYRKPPGSTRDQLEMLLYGFVNEWDGTFTSDSVSDSVRLAMRSKEGETPRANAREAKFLFGEGYK
ncbi:hypothetical protein RHSIM_Rhsim06G0071100 [Rhododendron simsii]|uniref:Uncharacterized protein n=1 Tax=Rhododendron simsii TaxID=118357 RepID=A0A834GTX4_RHOSS|nr:hypothetical protein RHSIM_Rhsim06G0071100 [Rhododendron simsii]